MKTVSIIQSNYIPWKGYFDIINDVDLFIFYDDVQYTSRDWRNRNKIKSPNGTHWLTVPVSATRDSLIYEVEFQDPQWASKHFKTISWNYSKAPYYKMYKDFLEYVYLEAEWRTLSEFNQFIIKHISREFLGIKTKFMDSREFEVNGRKLDRIIELLRAAEATHYISGPAAKNYIDIKKFSEIGIELSYKDYSGYREYEQMYPPFDHYVTILDLLFHAGPDSAYFIWGWREDKYAWDR